MVRAEFAQRAATVAQAEQFAAIHAALREARANPEVFVVDISARDAVAFVERAAVADLAVRLGLAEHTVRQQAHQALVLIQRAPGVWSAFRDGDICSANACTVADLAASLPNSPDAWAAFEHAVLGLAATLAPARFRMRARVAAESVDPQPAADRHARAAEQRRVWLEPDRDGMCWFGAYLAAPVAHRAMARINAMAVSLVAQPDEQRTLAQAQADVAADLLAGVLGSIGAAGVSVAVTVPVMTLLGAGEEPGILDGYGPIDAETARRLAAHAPSFARILTHPVSSTVLDVDRTSYRVPADLKRWLEVRDVECAFPGCGRRASGCDIDHTVAWADGGTTSADNLAHLCRSHHRIKHKTSWRATLTDSGMNWASPTGFVRGADPPPF